MARSLGTIGMGAMSLVFLAGCGPKAEDMMKDTPRPAALDRLNSLVGYWDGESEMTMKGAPNPMKATGTYRAEWACDKRFLVGHYEGDMGEGGKMSGIEIWTYDDKSGKYRTWWFDSHGSAAKGTSTYDEATKTWHTTGEDKNMATGTTTYGAGTMKLNDDNTMNWTWKQYNNGMKWGEPMMEMKGTSRRK